MAAEELEEIFINGQDSVVVDYHSYFLELKERMNRYYIQIGCFSSLLAGICLLLTISDSRNYLTQLLASMTYLMTGVGFLTAYYFSKQSNLTHSSNLACSAATLIVRFRY